MAEPTTADAPFRQVDPLITRPTPHAAADQVEVPPIGFRPDIEGLRAIAVVLVVLFHAELGPFGGGFIGVDVFFVVSGFLITSLLLGEVSRTGTLSLPAFWARRARRLMPASCLVIVVTLIAAQQLYDPLLLTQLARDALAACGFVINYVFAYQAANGDAGYFDADLAKSPLLHFWSLAVEEQFYLVWPAIVLGVVRIARRWRHELLLVIAALWVASLAFCIWLTNENTPWAFYSLPTRAWELLTGAMLAVSFASLQRLRRGLVLPMAIAGLAIIGVAAVTYDAGTTFPGIAAAVPVLGTALVLVAGSSLAAPGALRLVLGARPMLWVGQRSYAIYLWHWPALVLIGTEWGPLSATQRILVVLGSVVAAAVSFRLVEHPIHRSPWVGAQVRRGLLVGASCLTVAALVALLFLVIPREQSAGSEAATLTLPGVQAPDAAVGSTDPAPTTAAAAATAVATEPPATAASAATVAPAPTPATAAPTTLAPTTVTPAVTPLADLIALQQGLLQQGLTTQEVPSNLHPSLGSVRGELPSIYADGCVNDRGIVDPPPCIYGNPDAATTVAIVGDSHAAHWFPALQQIALARDWRLLFFSKKGCPPSEQPLRNDGDNQECNPWRDQALATITAERPAVIILTGYHYEARDDSAKGGDTLWREGMTTTLTKLGDLAPNVLILGDTPTEYANIPECLAGNLSSVPGCVSPRDYAVRGERLQVETELAAQFGTAFVDTSDWLCTPEACPVIIGDLLVYRDRNHLTPDASLFLAPLLEAALVPLVAS